MKLLLHTVATLILLPALATAEEAAPREAALAKHRDGATRVADQQDELSADVQQLTIEQTVPTVIELLSEVGEIMDEATDQLAELDTGGRTIAAQTEIIEKIHAAAKEKQKQEGSGQSGSAMMDMMERMMGKSPEGAQPGKGEGEDGPGEEAGQGATGLSDAANDEGSGSASGGKLEPRRVPKAGGSAGRVLPQEFRKALDAYNRGAEQKVK